MPVQELLGKKIGTTQMFLESGEAVCVTAVDETTVGAAMAATPMGAAFRNVRRGIIWLIVGMSGRSFIWPILPLSFLPVR